MSIMEPFPFLELHIDIRISDSYSSHYISSQLNVLIMEPFPLLYSKLIFANHRLYYWRLKKELCLKS